VVVIVHTLGFLPFKDRKTMTSVVSPHLNKFKWVASLWSEIDTISVPYIPFLNIVLPKLETKCIKGASSGHTRSEAISGNFGKDSMGPSSSSDAEL
jgi:hypothetical protein